MSGAEDVDRAYAAASRPSRSGRHHRRPSAQRAAQDRRRVEKRADEFVDVESRTPASRSA
jgi:hypothetical protein